jgi:hypothetical protein
MDLIWRKIDRMMG